MSARTGEGAGVRPAARARVLPVVVLLLLAALLLWAASRVTWLVVTAANDQSGEAVRSLGGGQWQPALVPLALGALAGVAAVALVRGLAARVVGVVLVALGLAGGSLLVGTLGEVDLDHVHAAVTSGEGEGGASSGRTNAGAGAGAGQGLPEWSEVTAVTTRPVGPALTAAGAFALVLGGGLLAARPPARTARDERYEAPAQRAGGRPSDTAGTPARGDAASADHGRELWDSLDSGDDPTADPTADPGTAVETDPHTDRRPSG